MNNTKDIVRAGGTALIKDLVRFLPLGGTAVAIHEELQAKQVERKIKRLEEFYTDLASSINKLQDKINQDYISTDDFLDIFEETTRYVVSERQENKRRLFKNILANSITATECNYDRTELYFRILDILGDVELRILAVLESPETYNKSHGMVIKDQINNSYQASFMETSASSILTQLLSIDIHELQASVTILFSYGLIVDNMLSRRLQTNGNPIHVLDNLLTVNGKRFVKFLR